MLKIDDLIWRDELLQLPLPLPGGKLHARLRRQAVNTLIAWQAIVGRRVVNFGTGAQDPEGRLSNYLMCKELADWYAGRNPRAGATGKIFNFNRALAMWLWEQNLLNANGIAVIDRAGLTVLCSRCLRHWVWPVRDADLRCVFCDPICLARYAPTPIAPMERETWQEREERIVAEASIEGEAVTQLVIMRPKPARPKKPRPKKLAELQARPLHTQVAAAVAARDARERELAEGVR